MFGQEKTRVFTAKKVITINPDQPFAEAVAVRDGRILAVGSTDELVDTVGDVEIDKSFADKVLMPGLIEAHSHMQLEGTLWNYAYVGYFDRTSPDGTSVSGCRSVAEVLDRLTQSQAAISDPAAPVVGWCYDPILLNDQPLTTVDLDRVSTGRPVVVLNASGHISYINNFLLQKAGITADTSVEGVIKGNDGRPTGELEEERAMFLAAEYVPQVLAVAAAPKSIAMGARLAHRVGCTTTSELGCLMGAAFDGYRQAVVDPAFPVRVAVSPLVTPMLQKQSPAQVMAYLDGATKDLPEKLLLGPVKWIVDGSIQGYTADLMWPGYCGSHSNPIVVTPLSELREQIVPFHKAGYQLAMHVNGDGATEIALQAVEAMLTDSPRLDHRHRLEHCQVASRSQFERIANLGMCVNLFSNHIYYWGDEHRAKTVGPDRTLRMDATATALDLGVHFSVHSDSPVTPVGPLFSAWCAVNRITRSGRVLGDHERISVADALAAVTIGSAYLLRRDADLGSIEVGKLADFTVLDEDPLTVAPTELKDVPVWGTVLGGEVLPAAA